MRLNRKLILAFSLVSGAAIFALSQGLGAAPISHGQAELQARAIWKQGDGLRAQRKFDVAVKAYEKSLEILTQTGDDRTTLGSAAKNMIEFCKAMPIDIKTLGDGTYEGKAWGYNAEMTVVVTLEKGRIKQFEVREQKESRPREALKAVPAQIFRLQSPNVEAASGATCTSYGLMTATVKALQQAKPAEKPADKPK